MDPLDWSWRVQAACLLCAVMHQTLGICWAISYVRQLEFMLKRKGKLDSRQHLSIQDFIDRIPKDKNLLYPEDGGAVDFTKLGIYLLNHGTLLESECPLTECVDGTVQPGDERPRLRPKKLVIHSTDQYFLLYGYEKGREKFHSKLEKLIKKKGLASLRIPVYESYDYLEGKDVFFPTDAEWNSPTPLNGHILVAVGCHRETDENRFLFLECQEFYGPEICDEGYVRIYADVITHFVEMDV
ncbi:hypothetical protein Bca4012_085417 [Brassica carinata]